MNAVIRVDLEALIQRPGGPCVSIYQPTHRVGPDTRAYDKRDPVRFKNLLRVAEQRLGASGLRGRGVSALLAPARKLLDDARFWQYQSNGLAVFVAPDVVRMFRVPLRFDELIVVGPRFHVTPLITLLASDGLFYVLALSQNEVRLLAGTRDHLSDVDVPGAPRDLDETLRYDGRERQDQLPTGRSAGGDGRAVLFHGHDEDRKASIFRFFQLVDRGVTARIRKGSVPLLLAAVDYLIPIYRRANTHPWLLEEGIRGNPEGLRLDELHARAWPVVEPYLTRARATAAARYRELRGTDQTTSDVAAVVPAAWDGRVDVLFVSVGIEIRGRFSPDTRSVAVGKETRRQQEDLLNLAAVHTILKGGTVYAVPPGQMPDETQVAALLRY